MDRACPDPALDTAPSAAHSGSMHTGQPNGGGTHGAWMTPEEAAAILDVGLDATTSDVERAYRRLARAVHPDRLAGASRERVAAAGAEFARVTLARDVMARQVGQRPVATSYATEQPRRTSRWIVLGWLAVLFVAGVISFYGGAFPYWAGDILLRLIPLAAVATAFALSGRRAFYTATIALLAVSVLVTLLFATFGSLVALALLLVPVIGLVVQGRKQAVRPRSAR
ncbi:MAG: hypothetical protein JWM50_236 [Microbacteriaceae bacterium]|jgi:hypothetical protein|nr:hypothetical protein [Microbacteriaceae bacterium]